MEHGVKETNSTFGEKNLPAPLLLLFYCLVDFLRVLFGKTRSRRISRIFSLLVFKISPRASNTHTLQEEVPISIVSTK